MKKGQELINEERKKYETTIKFNKQDFLISIKLPLTITNSINNKISEDQKKLIMINKAKEKIINDKWTFFVNLFQNSK